MKKASQTKRVGKVAGISIETILKQAEKFVSDEPISRDQIQYRKGIVKTERISPTPRFKLPFKK